MFSLADWLIHRFPIGSGFRAMIEVATRYEITNVAEYWYNDPRHEKDTYIHIADVAPNIAPLGDFSWFEWTLEPGKITGAHANKFTRTLYCGCAAMVLFDRKNPEHHDLLRKNPDIDPKARWYIDHTYFWRDKLGTSKYTPFSLTLIIDDDGRCIGTSHNDLTPWGAPKIDFTPEDEDLSVVTGYITPMLIATCFAHCKGVKTTEVRRQLSRQVRRAMERDKEPIISYSVLNIDPARKILADEGDVAHNGISKALHIVRGHFAHYTEAAPLFGKHVGTYYHPMHTRGTGERGTVVKDYTIAGGGGE